jgi:hypothetical protein
MNLYTEQQMRDAIKMARNGARSEDNIIDSLNFIKPYIELPSDEEMVKAKYEHEMCVFADEYASYVLEQSKSGIKGAMVSMCAWTFFKNRRNEQR